MLWISYQLMSPYISSSDPTKVPDLLGFGILKDLPEIFIEMEHCLNYYLIIHQSFQTTRIIEKDKPCKLHNGKNWHYFKELFKSSINTTLKTANVGIMWNISILVSN